MTDSFFPFSVHPSDKPLMRGSSYMESTFRALFDAQKDKFGGIRTTTFLSPTRVRFEVHGMRDTYWGGIGKIEATWETDVPAEVTLKNRMLRAEELAQDRREAELVAAERLIIRQYAVEILRESGS